MADEIRTEETMGAPAEGTGTAAAAAAPAQADPFADLAAPAAPSLSFGEPEPAAAAVQAAPAPAAAAVPQAEPEEAVLSPEEIKMVDAFVKQIDITNTQAVMTYGVGTQKKMADFSEKTLDSVRTKDLGEVGSMITSLVTELKNFEVDEEKKGIAGFFKKSSNRIQEMKTKYSKVETNVEAISKELE